MGNWVIGRNMAGFLPESDPFVTDDWEHAAFCLREDMREFAEFDDDFTYQWLMDTADMADYPDYESSGYGDDEPSTMATVASILKDDGPRDGQEWAGWVEDNQGRRWEFWLHATEDPVTDDEET